MVSCNSAQRSCRAIDVTERMTIIPISFIRNGMTAGMYDPGREPCVSTGRRHHPGWLGWPPGS
jgi:hypothetical protein